ncbi:regulator of g protein signaling [Anaeramoeba ignava]|uniref:Regulator of g protein signaling n=1 Tax=Anaeramoeba ignava TaxID=1746090 RepID=A0A9Q0RFL1_ANAIG|nr:regulator of g protein signaling [Anaeramoeba ignava]
MKKKKTKTKFKTKIKRKRKRKNKIQKEKENVQKDSPHSLPERTKIQKVNPKRSNQLLFWFHVHNYQQFCLLWEDSIAKIHAEYIINNFLKEDSQNTINIPQEIQQNILLQLNQMGENPVATLFDEALKIVHSSLISDKILHYRFLRSLHYKELLSEINEYKGLSSQNKKIITIITIIM